MEKKTIISTRSLTITITDFSDDSQNIEYQSDLRNAEKIGICEHIRVEALRKMGGALNETIQEKP